MAQHTEEVASRTNDAAAKAVAEEIREITDAALAMLKEARSRAEALLARLGRSR
jgi:hypothetical protein